MGTPDHNTVASGVRLFRATPWPGPRRVAVRSKDATFDARHFESQPAETPTLRDNPVPPRCPQVSIRHISDRGADGGSSRRVTERAAYAPGEYHTLSSEAPSTLSVPPFTFRTPLIGVSVTLSSVLLSNSENPTCKQCPSVPDRTQPRDRSAGTTTSARRVPAPPTGYPPRPGGPGPTPTCPPARLPGRCASA